MMILWSKILHFVQDDISEVQDDIGDVPDVIPALDLSRHTWHRPGVIPFSALRPGWYASGGGPGGLPLLG